MPIQLAIVTPREEMLAIECAEVVVPGSSGDIGLLPGHVPLVTTLRPGILTVVESAKPRYFAVGLGYAEIDDDRLTVLTEECLAPEQVDLEEARSDLERVERDLASHGPEDEAFAGLDVDARWARARLELKER